MTYVILKVVSLFVPLRASDGDVEGGDLAIHGIDPMPAQTVTIGKSASTESGVYSA